MRKITPGTKVKDANTQWKRLPPNGKFAREFLPSKTVKLLTDRRRVKKQEIVYFGLLIDHPLKKQALPYGKLPVCEPVLKRGSILWFRFLVA
jgi:hypothetical protein